MTPPTFQELTDFVENGALGLHALSPDGTILWANRADFVPLGYARDEYVGRRIADFHVDAAVADDLLRRLTAGEILREYEALLRCKDGSTRHVQVTARAAAGVFHCFTRDVTEQRRAEEALLESHRRLQTALDELQTAQKELVRQERLRALGQMAGGIAHDINNALAAILGYCELLLARPDYLGDRERAVRYLEHVREGAHRAASTVARLRGFARPRARSESRRLLDLGIVLRRAVEAVRPYPKGVTVDIEIGGVLPVVGNENEMREAMIQLFQNGVDALPLGGAITLRARREGSNVRLDVADTGTGMSDEARRQCLEPFYTTKGPRHAGLGLAMVYGIIQRHEGTLDIVSRPDAGTTVIVRLPIPQTVSTKAARPLHVLVVDDEPPVREVLSEYLTADGHTVETAANGREGLEKFYAGYFDVIVTDQAMPEMQGSEMAAAIRKVAAKKPIIMVSATEDRPACVDAVLSKPVSMDALRDAIGRLGL